MTKDAHDVSRQQQKSTKSNVIDQVLEVKVILDQPWEDDDKWELKGENFSKTLTIKDAEDLVKGEKILRFKVKPNKKGYRLIHHRSKDSPKTVFLDKLIQHMTEAGHPHKTSPYSYAHLPSQVRTKLPDRYGTDRDVDKDLIQASPILVNLKVEDPEL